MVESRPNMSLVAVCEAISIMSEVLTSSAASIGSGMIGVGAGGLRVMRMAEGGQLLVDHSSDAVGGVNRVVVVLVSCTLALR